MFSINGSLELSGLGLFCFIGGETATGGERLSGEEDLPIKAKGGSHGQEYK